MPPLPLLSQSSVQKRMKLASPVGATKALAVASEQGYSNFFVYVLTNKPKQKAHYCRYSNRIKYGFH